MMNTQNKFKIFLLFILIYFGGILLGFESPQKNPKKSNLDFANHLYMNQDFEQAAAEYLRIYHLYPNTAKEEEILNLNIGICLSKIDKYKEANHYFQNCLLPTTTIDVYNQALAKYALNLTLDKDYQKSLRLINQYKKSDQKEQNLLNTLIPANHFLLRDIPMAKERILIYEKEGFKYFNQLKILMELRNQLKNKPPWLAGVFSAIIPGSGRVYAGRVKEGFVSFFLVTSSAYLSYDSFKSQGIKSFNGWMFGSIAAILYVGNIYGSILSIKLRNKKIDIRINKGIEILLKRYK